MMKPLQNFVQEVLGFRAKGLQDGVWGCRGRAHPRRAKDVYMAEL